MASSSKAKVMTAEVIYPDGCRELAGELSKDEIIKRLVRLAKEFQEMGQEENDKYKGLAMYLASEYFMEHQNKDVRLLTACCIADIFRIFAPDAPYTEASHLKTIFLFLVKQLRGLEETEAVSFKRYFYLLENLAWVKSFNICIELEDSQEIFTNLFKMIFTIVNTNHTHKVKSFMLDLMAPLITESDVVGQDMLDAILINIIEPNKSLHKEACNLAKELIRRTTNALEPFVQIFFNNCLLLGKTSESEVSDHMYSLIYELNQVSPSVLLAVLPQLEYKLKSNDEEERKALTRLLAKMFSDKDSDLAVQNKQLWQCFLGRFNDINVQVRTTCVQSIQHFILNQTELMKDVYGHLTARLHDQEESVRHEAVCTIVSATRKNLAAVPDDILHLLKERVRDKKFKIRKEALLGLGQIYKKELLKEDPAGSELSRIGWIRSKVLHGYYQNSMEDRILVERIFKLCLVPYTMEGSLKMATLYELYADLDDNAIKAIKEMLRCQHSVVVLVRQMLDLLKCELTADVSKALAAKLFTISKNLPDHSRMHEHIKRFANIVKDDSRVRKQLSSLLSQEISCKKAEECVKEILKKMGNPTPQNVFYTCIKTFLERIAPVLIDSTSMRTLLTMVTSCINQDYDVINDNRGERGRQLLLILSQLQPGAFDDPEVFKQLISLLDHESDVVADNVLQILSNTGHRVQKHDVIYDDLIPKLEVIAKQGTPKQSKHSIHCVNSVCKERDSVLIDIVEHLKNDMKEGCDNLLTVLVALGHIAQIGPQEISAGLKPTIVQYVVKSLLLNDQYTGEETDDDWWDDERITIQTKEKDDFICFLSMIEAMKLMCRWCIGIKKHAMASNNGPSTIKMLNTMILHDGDVLQAGLINKPERARLRLQAACCILKLAQEPVYAKMITQEQFHILAYVMAEPCDELRLAFCMKLQKGLLSLRLPLQYMSIFALAAPWKKSDNRELERSALVQNINKRREYIKQQLNNSTLLLFLPDYVLPYVVHLLAHHPDLITYDDVEALKRIKDCLWFLLEPLIVKNDTYSYTFYRQILENIKHRKDALDPDDEVTNMKLYAVCDLAIGLITSKSSNFVLKDHPIEPSLPDKLFVRADSNFTNTKVYLPKQLTFTPPRKKAQQALMPLQADTPANTTAGKTETEIDGSGDELEFGELTNDESLEETMESLSGDDSPAPVRKRVTKSLQSRKAAAAKKVDPTLDQSDADYEPVTDQSAVSKKPAAKKTSKNNPTTKATTSSKDKNNETTEDNPGRNTARTKRQPVKKTSGGLQTTLDLVVKKPALNIETKTCEGDNTSEVESIKKSLTKLPKEKKTVKSTNSKDTVNKENKTAPPRGRGRPKKVLVTDSTDSETPHDTSDLDNPSLTSSNAITKDSTKTAKDASRSQQRDTPLVYKPYTPEKSPVKTPLKLRIVLGSSSSKSSGVSSKSMTSSPSKSTASRRSISSQDSVSPGRGRPKKVKKPESTSPRAALLSDSPRKALLFPSNRGKKRPSTPIESSPPTKRPAKDTKRSKTISKKTVVVKSSEKLLTKKGPQRSTSPRNAISEKLLDVKQRGRPKKRVLVDSTDSSPSNSPCKQTSSQSSSMSPSPAKRKPGRPSKVLSSNNSSPVISVPEKHSNIRKGSTVRQINGQDSTQDSTSTTSSLQSTVKAKTSTRQQKSNVRMAKKR